MAPPSTSWSPPRAKIQLKLSIQRIKLLATKKFQLAKVTRREISTLLEKGKLESARIKVEAVMGEDFMIELLEILELYCELLLARFGLLDSPSREIDPGVSEAVSGIIYAAPRTELKELHTLRELLMSKFGRDFAVQVMEDHDNVLVSKRITSKLAVTQPPAEIVDIYLHEIAKAYGLPWAPEGYVDPDASSNLSTATPEPFSQNSISEPTATTTTSSSVEHPAAVVGGKTATVTSTGDTAALGNGGGGKKEEEDPFAALTKRFAELKKK